MIRDAWFLARKDVRHMFREKSTWLWTFVMPIVFFYFIGTITGGFRGPADPRDPIGVLAPADAGFLAEEIVKRLESQNFRLVRTATPVELARFTRRLTFPAGFTASVLAGKQATVNLERTGGGESAEYDRIRLSRAIYGVLADLVEMVKENTKASPDAFTALAAKPKLVTLDVKSAGRRRTPPTGFEQAVPGTMVMFTLLVLFTTGGVTLLIERTQGILRRLASSPLSRGAVVLGKWSARVCVGLVQIAFAMAVGSLLFGVRWGDNLPAVALLMLSYAALAASLGVLLGNFLGSPSQVVGVGVLSTNVMAALGGCWWPVEITPVWMQKLALFFPTGWAMDALHKLVSFGEPVSAVMPHVAVLSLAAAVAGWMVARSFRFQ